VKFAFNPLTSQFEPVAISCGSGSGSIVFPTASNPIILNIAMPLSGTEYSLTLPIGTKRFQIRVRSGAAPLQLSYTAGSSGTLFMDMPRGCNYTEENLALTSILPVYFQSSTASITVECTIWT